MFLYACESIVSIGDKKSFDQHFTPILMKIAQDKVPNVRLALANLIQNAMRSEVSPFNDDEEFKAIKKILSEDKDIDVQYFTSNKNLESNTRPCYSAQLYNNSTDHFN